MFYWRFHFDNETPVNCSLLDGNEHIYWILDLQSEVHLIWDLRVSGLQECKSNELFQNTHNPRAMSSGRWASIFGRVQKKLIF